MGARRKAREYALQILYLADITRVGAEKALRSVLHGANPEEQIAEFTTHLVNGTRLHLPELDAAIEKYAKNWEMARMAALDRNILRMGAFELMYEPKTPVSVIIDEAVEIAKTFSTEESGKFVNGILDQIKNERKQNGTVKKD